MGWPYVDFFYWRGFITPACGFEECIDHSLVDAAQTNLLVGTVWLI